MRYFRGLGISFARGAASALPFGLLLTTATGCGESSPSGLTAREVDPVRRAYADAAHGRYLAARDAASELRTAIVALLEQPSEASLKAARASWLTARTPYLETEVFRFYGGPIDEEGGPEPRLNAWPMDEAYVDYVEGDPESGIIQDPTTYPEISKTALSALNEAGSETNIATGYHAIEFLLWGQDLSTTGPGDRPFTDFVPGEKGTGGHPERRAKYLEVLADLLVDDLSLVVQAWDPEGGAYRASFLAEAPEESIRRIMLGMGSLSGPELAGERLTVAYDTREQEDEHSCFSDNTHNDMLHDALGIQHVYLGHTHEGDAAGIEDLVRSRDAELADRLGQELADTVETARALPTPFDQAVRDEAERVAVKTLIDNARRQADTIAEAAALLGIALNLE